MPVNTAPVAEADITLASTSETQAELDHATGPNWREHFEKPAAPATEEKPAEEPKGSTKTEKPAPGTGSEKKPAAAAGEGGNEKDDEPLPKGVQKRLDRITARLRDVERENETLKAGQKPAPAAGAKPAADPEPQQKDFPSWEKWNEAHSRWAVRDEQRQQAAKDQREAAEAQSKQNYDAHLERVETARTAHDDFDEVVKAGGSFDFASPAANMAFQVAIVEADNGPEVLYHLAKNPAEMAKFEGLSPARVQMLVGRISSALSPDSSKPAGDKPGAAATAKPAPKSQTPAPTTPVRRPTTATGSDYRNPESAKAMTDDEWIKSREADLRSRKARRF